ncbi:MAG TPA: NADP-dependent isocitrate dehydrogenase [Gammaproteobacteria bacterium]|nr:NADP-dependent isocitrate dehydrogenase [Gammaproteobacteria bacterium]
MSLHKHLGDKTVIEKKPEADITLTWTDEAPRLASYSLFPIVQKFLSLCGITVQTSDISLAARILAQFPDRLTEGKAVSDDLSYLGDLAKRSNANIIKLPNISASVPQLKKAIAELQRKGFDVPDFNDHPLTGEETEIYARYARVLGSAVNPVLREGNSDRRAPEAVKEFAKKNPHRMGKWSSESLTHISTMGDNDFRHNEKSVTIEARSVGNASICFFDENNRKSTLTHSIPLDLGTVVDTTYMDVKALQDFYKSEIADAKKRSVLFSLHLKATMMKISDPLLFGYAVKTFFEDLFTKHQKIFTGIGFNPNDGIGDLLAKIKTLPKNERDLILSDITLCLDEQPKLHMVNSDKGITNLHVPNDVIIDASMPAIIRNGGKGWASDGSESDIKCVIPDSSYAAVYDETIKFCVEHGAFNPATMGTVSNIGLMAKKAEEYGSHNTTFVASGSGSIKLLDEQGAIITEHDVEAGDIWRLCLTQADAIKNWIELGISRAKLTKLPTIFWLDKNRPHDSELIKKITTTLVNDDIRGANIEILSPREATKVSLSRAHNGLDTISVTGNVLRDYLTDLFPILELGTSAKMLSIVPLMKGGGLFETGAGGSAPKHVEQLLNENHLRWDSLGEFTAIAASLEHLANSKGLNAASTLGEALDKATQDILESGKSPSPKVKEIDSRGSHFYLALFWAKALCRQKDNVAIADLFRPIYEALESNETVILEELNEGQGSMVDIGGYFLPEYTKASKIMRPSERFNKIVDKTWS